MRVFEVLAVSAALIAVADAKTVSKTTASGKMVLVYTYVNWKSDCSSNGGVVKVITKPQHGNLSPRRGNRADTTTPPFWDNEFAGSTINCSRATFPFRGRRSMLITPTTSLSVSTLSLRRTARTFPVTSSGAKKSGWAWPSNNTVLDTGGRRRTSLRSRLLRGEALAALPYLRSVQSR